MHGVLLVALSQFTDDIEGHGLDAQISPAGVCWERDGVLLGGCFFFLSFSSCGSCPPTCVCRVLRWVIMRRVTAACCTLLCSTSVLLLSQVALMYCCTTPLLNWYCRIACTAEDPVVRRDTHGDPVHAKVETSPFCLVPSQT